MKIGIMSMQRVVNYGSFLQAYALKRQIEDVLQGENRQVEFVDYEIEPSLIKNDEKKMDFNVKMYLLKILKMLSPKYRRYRNQQKLLNRTFSEFSKAYNETFLPTIGVKKAKVYCPELDVLVIGSDEVFNCTQKGTLVGYSRQLFGKDNRAKKLISYAASFGTTTLEKLEKYHIINDIAGDLSCFDALSVRDTNSQNVVAALCGQIPCRHIDPVLLYDFGEVDTMVVDRKDYLIVYAYADRITKEEAKEIRAFAKSKNLKVIALGFYQPFCDEYILAKPLEVLAYVKNAAYVVTDTFHGTVFSIKYQIPFATIIRESNKQKLGDLLELFQLTERKVTCLSKLPEILEAKMDLTNIRDILAKERESSLSYLYNHLLG
ncbi:polysaccharide pyruvyl transferase family protein [Bacteroides acidifaciens]|uniref:polysaccharide pyruvyl transferase family protein n=1 Tax=Bacteroides acidifaciens TaxID=85831 RepID=UPI00158D2BAA|nr:polysaccharide pyruvyl transferase family protein [Bacteroides acidifaciens]